MENKRGKSKYIVIIAIILAVLAVLFKVFYDGPSDESTTNIDVQSSQKKNIQFTKEGQLSIYKMGGDSITTIDIEIAESDEERQQGMMYRQTMKGNQGMLFIFDEEKLQSFWMKNTYVPLDIIFITEDLRISDQYLGAKPKSTKSIRSRRPAKYVLEVTEGFCKAFNVGPGMKVEFERLN